MGSLWMSRATICAVVANLVGGLYLGFSMGYVPVTIEYETYIANCTRYVSEAACSHLEERSGCVWLDLPLERTGDGVCYFKDRVRFGDDGRVDMNKTAPCGRFSSSDCAYESGCYFDPKAQQCKHVAGWDAIQQGVFAAMLIIGCMAGGALAGPLLSRWPHQFTFAIVATCGTVAMILQFCAWQYNIYGLYVAARFVVGLAGGAAAVACPMYCGEVAPPEIRTSIGVTFQMWLCGGLFFASIVGVAISPAGDTTSSDGLVSRFHALNGAGCICCVLLFAAAVFLPKAAELLPDELQSLQQQEPTTEADPVAMQSEISLRMAVAVAIAMATNQQMTGINAICTYAPQITHAAGLEPLTGNAIVMAWNFAAAICCVPLSRKVALRRIYLCGASLVCTACAVVAISAYPGVISDAKSKEALELAGIFLFLLAYECGPGPVFYVLAQSAFPPRYRALGCSLCNTLQFTWNVIINFGFPVSQQALSGGRNANQDKGLALCFVVFFVMGSICTLFLMRKMP